LNTGVWFRRGRLLIVSPVRGHHRRYQAETPLIPLSRFAEPAINNSASGIFDFIFSFAKPKIIFRRIHYSCHTESGRFRIQTWCCFLMLFDHRYLQPYHELPRNSEHFQSVFNVEAN
jgi:hypothetical protein